MSYNLVLVIITVIVSLIAWRDPSLLSKLIFWPARMKAPDEYHRFVTHGFIHADYMHLFFNMFTLYFIGSFVEKIDGQLGNDLLYPLMYLMAIIAASVPSYVKNKNNVGYRSLGASGGVSAVLMSMVYFAPWQTIYVWFIPMYSILFALVYLAYTIYMAKKQSDL